ncbi:MAG: beta-N-acetylhexosaminidase [Bdellovibrio sp.]|nr:MAG: beta-N-acetylhexosaminidase [Bdellovibrio sp.]
MNPEKIGQLFVIGLEGPFLSEDEARFIVENNIGGVILFDRNCQSPDQIHQLCTDIYNLRFKQPEKLPLFIGIDMEGGRVQRLKPPFTQWPPLQRLEKLDSTSMAFKLALAMGQELRAAGINLDFAPCVDVLTNPQNQVIGDRSIGKDPEHVAKMSSALVRGYIKSGIVPCAKHFPGHGDTVADSHEELPVQDTSYEDLQKRELIPFKKVFRARLDMVMTAHIQFKNIDSEWPVTLSPHFIQDILRKDYRFRNLVITDDLDMKALTNHYSKEQIPVQALKAGCDLLLYCNDPESPQVALEALKKSLQDGQLSAQRVEESYSRVMHLKKTKLTPLTPLSWEDARKVIGHPDHLRLSKAINDGQILEDLKLS